MVSMDRTEEITVLGNKVRLLQLADSGFRTSLDSVMLAAACPVKPSESVLDMGCGVGGASFCLLHRVPDIRLTGVEWERKYFDLANKNISLNHAECRAEFIHSDIRDFMQDEKPMFHHVMVNPPYREAGHHSVSPDIIKAQALGHLEEDLSLEDWILSAHRLLKSGGSFTIIYPTSGTDRIIRAMGKKFGAIEIFPLWPHAGEESKRVIIRARKDRKTPCRLLSGLVLHQADGSYTAETEKILRDGDCLMFNKKATL